MSSVMHPVGDKPPNVYWRRRVVALVALLVVLLLVVLLVKAIAGLFGGGNAAAPAPSTTPTAAAASTASATNSGSATTSGSPGSTPCAPDAIKVSATSDSKSVTVGKTMKVGMLIENVSQADCTLDAGSANLELVISSGNESIWSSDDCQQGGENRPTVVRPGERLGSEVAWDVKRSASGCPADLPKLQAGTYQLKARVGDINSDSLTFMVKSDG